MSSTFKEVSRDDFHRFIDTYPRKLTYDVTGICEPPLAAYYDFEAEKGPNAMVARYHLYPKNPRTYWISEHLL